jgi:hypothetical protein
LCCLSTSAFASGFQCTSTEGYNAQVYNYTTAKLGTDTPAAFIISEASQGTVLVATGTEITKQNTKTSVQYTAKGTTELNANSATLQVDATNDGNGLADGEQVDGGLVLTSGSNSQTFNLVCTRYLKD